MKTIKKIPVRYEMVGNMPDLRIMNENMVYISREHGLAMHRCLCGCGQDSVTLLNEFWKDNDGWDYKVDSENRLTFTPSILNMNCPNKYHYIITNGIANVV